MGRFNRFSGFYHPPFAKYHQLIAKSTCLHDFQSIYANSEFLTHVFDKRRSNCCSNQVFWPIRVDLRCFQASITLGSQDICKSMVKSSLFCYVVLGRFNRFPGFYQPRFAKYNQLISKSTCLHDFQSIYANSEFLTHVFDKRRSNCCLNRVFWPIRVDLRCFLASITLGSQDICKSMVKSSLFCRFGSI